MDGVKDALQEIISEPLDLPPDMYPVSHARTCEREDDLAVLLRGAVEEVTSRPRTLTASRGGRDHVSLGCTGVKDPQGKHANSPSGINYCISYHTLPTIPLAAEGASPW